MTRRFVCLVDDPAVFAAAPGLREHHAQKEIGGDQWVCLVYGDASTWEYLEAAGASIVDEGADASAEIPPARAQRLAGPSRAQSGERVHQMLRRMTQGFDVRKF